MKLLICALLFACVLLAGCLGSTVSKADYDSLKADCEAEKKSLNSELADAKADAKENARLLASCQAQSSSLQTQLQKSTAEASSMRNDYSLAAQAKNKTAKIAAYENVRIFYLDAFGEGRIPNTARIKKIEDAVASLPDAALYSLLGKVKVCSSIDDCARAKAAFIAAIDEKERLLKEEIVALFSGK